MVHFACSGGMLFDRIVKLQRLKEVRFHFPWPFVFVPWPLGWVHGSVFLALSSPAGLQRLNEVPTLLLGGSALSVAGRCEGRLCSTQRHGSLAPQRTLDWVPAPPNAAALLRHSGPRCGPCSTTAAPLLRHSGPQWGVPAFAPLLSLAAGHSALFLPAARVRRGMVPPPGATCCPGLPLGGLHRKFRCSKQAYLTASSTCTRLGLIWNDALKRRSAGAPRCTTGCVAGLSGSGAAPASDCSAAPIF